MTAINFLFSSDKSSGHRCVLVVVGIVFLSLCGGWLKLVMGRSNYPVHILCDLENFSTVIENSIFEFNMIVETLLSKQNF